MEPFFIVYVPFRRKKVLASVYINVICFIVYLVTLRFNFIRIQRMFIHNPQSSNFSRIGSLVFCLDWVTSACVLCLNSITYLYYILKMFTSASFPYAF